MLHSSIPLIPTAVYLHIEAGSLAKLTPLDLDISRMEDRPIEQNIRYKE